MYKQLRDADMSVGYEGGMCLSYVQNAYHTNHIYPRAIDAWNAEPNKHTDRPPAGVTVPVYLSLGDVPAGHVAIELSDGWVASSTQPGVHSTPYYHKSLDDLIAVYGKYNGGATYLGWGENVGTVHVVEWQNPNATAAQIKQAYLEILERPADDDGLAHYSNYPIDFVRQDLLNSAEYKLLQQHKANLAAAQAADAAAKQAAADAKAKADADAAAKAEADAKAREEAAQTQPAPAPVAAPVQNQPAKQPTLYDWAANLVKLVINWLKQWRKS